VKGSEKSAPGKKKRCQFPCQARHCCRKNRLDTKDEATANGGKRDKKSMGTTNSGRCCPTNARLLKELLATEESDRGYVKKEEKVIHNNHGRATLLLKGPAVKV